VDTVLGTEECRHFADGGAVQERDGVLKPAIDRGRMDEEACPGAVQRAGPPLFEEIKTGSYSHHHYELTKVL
jgi:hypothetical protein